MILLDQKHPTMLPLEVASGVTVASTPRPNLKHYVGRVALSPLSIMTNLRYCDITRGSDIATEHVNTRLPCPRGLVILTL